MTVLLASCTADEQWRGAALGAERAEGPGSFYRWAPDELDGDPGTLVRAERILGAPADSTAWRILFRPATSTMRRSSSPASSSHPTQPADTPRPVVSWGHPTTGAAQACAPSLGADPFVLIEGATDLLADGYVVVAERLPRDGRPGSVVLPDRDERGTVAAGCRPRREEVRDADAGDELLLWGHSQGGHAALFAARESATYAPDLDVRAVAVAAPAVELAQLLADDIADSAGVALGSYAFWAYDRTFASDADPPHLDQILTPDGTSATPAMADLCLIGDHRALHRIADPLVGRYLAHSPTDEAPWSTLLEQNTPTALPYDMPVFVAQGGKDHLVRPATTADYVKELCAAGQPVQFHRVPGASHLTIATDSLPDVQQFFSDALDDRRTNDTC